MVIITNHLYLKPYHSLYINNKNVEDSNKTYLFIFISKILWKRGQNGQDVRLRMGQKEVVGTH